MKTYPFRSAQVFRLAGLAQVVCLFLMLPLTNVCFGAPQTNTVPWTETFETFTDYAPLINGTNGWYSIPGIYDTNMPAQTSIVQNVLAHSGSLAARVAIGDTLSNSFRGSLSAQNIKLEMYVLPQLMTSSVYPSIAANVAAQFFISSNGYFVVGNGTGWNEAVNMPAGAAQNVTNISYSTNFVRIQVHLQYNTYMWGLKAWTNDDAGVSVLVASTNYLSFSSNLNYFSGFSIYSGTASNYVDDITVRLWPSVKVNGVSLDTIKRIDGALPGGKINDVNVQ